MERKGLAIGIDLGTTYSCVAVWRNGRPEIVVNAEGNRTTPSCVAFKDSDLLVGDAAKSQCHSNPTNTISGVKRLVGRKFKDPYVQQQVKLLPFRVESGAEDKPVIVVEHNGEEKRFFTEEISSMILGTMKSTAESFLEEPVDKAVVTVPAYFTNSQRRATKEAGRKAGLNVVRILNEPTAAAVAYGLDKAMPGQNKNLLIFDLGGGTFDVSILRMEGTVLQVKATAGDSSLGGEDFDERMVRHLLAEFERRHGVDLSGNAKALRRMRTACERAKTMLSFSMDTLVELEYIHKEIDFLYTFTRARFEELNLDLFERCMKVVQSCLRDAGLRVGEIDDVVLAGGSTRIPKVQEMLQELFDGKELCKSINPDEAVAFGAVVQAAKLAGQGGRELEDLHLLDVTPFSLGTSLGDGRMSVIIPRNTPIPVCKKHKYVTGYNNQPAVRVDVYEGEEKMVAENNFLGEFIFRNLPRAPAGKVSVEVTFSIDADGILSVSAENKLSGATKKMTISDEMQQQPPEDEWRRAREVERLRSVDERVAARSRLEAVVRSVGRRAREGALGRKETLRKMVEDKVEKARRWLEENPEAEASEYERRRTKLEVVLEGASNLAKS